MASKYKYRPKNEKLGYKPVVIIVAIVVVIALIAFYQGNFEIPKIPETTIPTTTVTTTVTTTPEISNGAVAVAVKDVKQKLRGLGDATELKVKITEIKVHAASGGNESINETDDSGWITIFEGEKTVDILSYTDTIAVIAEKELESGKYTQLRMHIDSGSIKIYNTYTQVYNKTFPINIPSKELKFVHPFTIEEGKKVVITLDFDVVESVTKKDTVIGIGITYRFDPTCQKCIKILDQTVDIGQLPENAVKV
jgi:hypothetical protein